MIRTVILIRTWISFCSRNLNNLIQMLHLRQRPQTQKRGPMTKGTVEDLRRKEEIGEGPVRDLLNEGESGDGRVQDLLLGDAENRPREEGLHRLKDAEEDQILQSETEDGEADLGLRREKTRMTLLLRLTERRSLKR